MRRTVLALLGALFFGEVAMVRAAGDGIIHPEGLFADSGELFLSTTEPLPGAELTFRLAALDGDLTEASLVWRVDGGTPVGHPMAVSGTWGRMVLWSATCVLPSSASQVEYWYEARDGAEARWVDAFGVRTVSPAADPGSTQPFRLVPGFSTPAWIKGCSWYQIFPDRFFDGDPSNNVQTGEYDYFGPVQARAWGDVPEGAKDFFGGDLQGVAARLGPYLQKRLGIGAIYLNPVFLSPSNHKYDTQDYDQVDPHFGGDKAFADLAALARSPSDFEGDYRVRVMLDGVFNHCGDRHRWFDRGNGYPDTQGAFESQSSPWYGRFTFTEWRKKYVCFNGFSVMPKLNYADAGLRADILDGPGSLAAKWLAGPGHADGWRLDVGQEVGESGILENDAFGRAGVGRNNHALWRTFRRTVKAAEPDAVILGEYWGRSYGWLRGGEWDSAMNYNGFTIPLGRWLFGTSLSGQADSLDGASLHGWLQGTLADVPGCVVLGMLNSLGTHDIPRPLNRCGGSLETFRAAVAFQMTYPGAPCVYYGDEVALEGGADPDNRRTFPWSELDRPDRAACLDFHVSLLSLRRTVSCLRTGSYRELFLDSDTLAFARFDSRDTVLTVVRRGGGPTAVSLPVSMAGEPEDAIFQDALSFGTTLQASGGMLSVPVAGPGFRVLARRCGTPDGDVNGDGAANLLDLVVMDAVAWGRLTPWQPPCVWPGMGDWDGGGIGRADCGRAAARLVE